MVFYQHFKLCVKKLLSVMYKLIKYYINQFIHCYLLVYLIKLKVTKRKSILSIIYRKLSKHCTVIQPFVCVSSFNFMKLLQFEGVQIKTFTKYIIHNAFIRPFLWMCLANAWAVVWGGIYQWPRGGGGYGISPGWEVTGVPGASRICFKDCIQKIHFYVKLS